MRLDKFTATPLNVDFRYLQNVNVEEMFNYTGKYCNLSVTKMFSINCGRNEP